MPEIKRCPVCDEPPDSCLCRILDRWISLDGLFIHITPDGFVDVRVLETTTAKQIEHSASTILEWERRACRERIDRFGDLLAELDERKRAGETWGELTKAVNRRLSGYLDRMKRGNLTEGAARTFIWHDLSQLGVGDDRAGKRGRLNIAEALIDAAKRSDDPLEGEPPIHKDWVKTAVRRWRETHSS
jgi:hypothetical protein